MKKILITLLSLFSLMCFASDENFQKTFEKVNPGKTYNKQTYLKYLKYKNRMYKMIEHEQKLEGKASEEFYQKIAKNFKFFQKYFSEYVKTEHEDHPEINSAQIMVSVLLELRDQEEIELIDQLEEGFSECVDEATDPTCGDKNISEDGIKEFQKREFLETPSSNSNNNEGQDSKSESI